MKFLAVVAATLVTAAVVTPVPASAAPARHGYRWKNVCKVQMRHHRRVRTCRRVRVRW